MATAPAIGSSFESSPFRAIELFFPPTHSCIQLLQGMSLRYGSFLALGGPPGRAFRGFLAAPVCAGGAFLDVRSGGPQLPQCWMQPNHLFAYLLVHALFIWPHCLRALTFSRRLLRSSFEAFEPFEINPLKLVSKPRRFGVCLFRFDEVFDIVATIDLFL